MSPEQLDAISTRHALNVSGFRRLPDSGIINAIYRLGDSYVLRVPRNHPKHIEQTLAEAIAAPAAFGAGLRTHRLVAFDDACDLLPVPYTIFEWIDGEPIEHRGEMRVDSDAWRDLGRDLARLHAIARQGPVATLAVAEEFPDALSLVEQRASEGWFTSLEASWLSGWLERLSAAVDTGSHAPRLLHQDTQPTNIIVRGQSSAYVALIDWGCAGWGDESFDFCMPMRFVPDVIAGHREVAPFSDDDSIEARILRRGIQMILYVLPRGATPGLSWAEHPLSNLMEITRFLLDNPGGRWREWGPSEVP